MGNQIEVAWSLRAKFDAENAQDAAKAHDQPQDILMIRSKIGRQEECSGVDNLAKSMQGLTFSAKDPQTIGW